MANREDYKGLLGERLESAYKAKGNIKPPSEVDIARWKQLAKARKREKRRRAKIVASLASAFAMVFCISIVSMFQIPDAQAGEDQIINIRDSKDDEAIMTVDTYRGYDGLPEYVQKECLILQNLPYEYKLSELRVITVGERKRYESEFKQEGGNSFTVKQKNIDKESNLDAITINCDSVETWDGVEVYIKDFLEDDKQKMYSFIIENSFIIIMADRDVEDEVIKNITKEANNVLAS